MAGCRVEGSQKRSEGRQLCRNRYKHRAEHVLETVVGITCLVPICWLECEVAVAGWGDIEGKNSSSWKALTSPKKTA